MQKTSNYNLNQWDAGDRVLREDFNADNAAIDAALANKADAEDLTALAETTAAAMGSGGYTCRLAYGTYTGTGNVGSSNKNTLTFAFKPVLVFIIDEGGSGIAFMMTGSAQALFTSVYNTVSWSGNSVSWYYNGEGPGNQLNISGKKYIYAAIGY